MRSGQTIASVVACVAIALCSAACTSSGHAEPTGDTPAPSAVVPSREPLPQQAVTPADDADPSTWSISAAGIGPVVIGNALQGLEVHMAAFSRDDSGCLEATLATWVRPRSPSVRVLADSAGRIVGVAVTGPTTVAAGTLAASPRTRSGDGVGSPIEAVQRSFPALVEFDGGTSTTGARIDSWGVPVGDRWVTFQLDAPGERVRTVWVGLLPTPPDPGCD